MNAFIKFNRGILRLPILVRVWLTLLMAVNLLAPIIYIQRSEARIVLLTFLASFLVMILITGASGFTRLLGLGHVLWVPLLFFLFSRLDSIPVGGSYSTWIRSVIALNSISLVLDLVDVVRFARGERSEIVLVK
jgi:hypothetical protein